MAMTDKIKVTAPQLGKIIADYLGGIARPLSASEQVAFDRTYEVMATPKKERLRYTPSTPAERARRAAAAAEEKHSADLRAALKAKEATDKLIRAIMRKFG